MFNYIIGVLLDLISLPLVIAAYPTAYFDSNPKHLSKDVKRATLCVHGFLHNQSAWIAMRSHLKACPEAGAIFSLNLGHPFQSIEDYTKCVQQKIQAIKEMSGGQELEINLIGHSMGGLVCSNYAVKYAKKDHVRVARVVTIASPLQGSIMAYIGKWCGCKCSAKMTPRSEFIKNLTAKVKQLKDVHFYHIGCAGDAIVLKNHTYFEGRHNHLELPYQGHISALFSSRIRNFVIEAIQKEE